jgi:hypothetical protein
MKQRRKYYYIVLETSHPHDQLHPDDMEEWINATLQAESSGLIYINVYESLEALIDDGWEYLR